MHLALDGDIGVRDGSSEELAEGAEAEGHGGRDVALTAGLEDVLHLLEERVLQDGVGNEHKRGDDAAEQRLRALLAQQREQRAERRGGPRFPFPRRRDGGAAALDHELARGLEGLAARRHARVDDPDRVREDHRRGPRERARDHGLDRRELLGGAPGLGGGGLLEEGARPLVPVVVDEVGHADAEYGAVEPRVQAGHPFARDDAPHGGEEVRLGSLRLDLGARGEGYEGVSVCGARCLLAWILSARSRWSRRDGGEGRGEG